MARWWREGRPKILRHQCISGSHYFPSIIVKGRVSSIPPGGDLFLKASVYIIRPVFGKTADIRRMGPDASLPYIILSILSLTDHHPTFLLI